MPIGGDLTDAKVNVGRGTNADDESEIEDEREEEQAGYILMMSWKGLRFH